MADSPPFDTSASSIERDASRSPSHFMSNIDEAGASSPPAAAPPPTTTPSSTAPAPSPLTTSSSAPITLPTSQRRPRPRPPPRRLALDDDVDTTREEEYTDEEDEEESSVRITRDSPPEASSSHRHRKSVMLSPFVFNRLVAKLNRQVSVERMFMAWHRWAHARVLARKRTRLEQKNRALKQKKAVLNESLQTIAEMEAELQRRQMQVSAQAKRQAIQRTFFRLSNFLILGFVAILIYYDYQMVQPHASTIFFAALVCIFLGRPQTLIEHVLYAMDAALGEHYVQLTWYSLVASVVLCVVMGTFLSTLLILASWILMVCVLHMHRRTVSSLIMMAVVLFMVAFPLFLMLKTCVEESEAIVKRVSNFIGTNRQLEDTLEQLGRSQLYNSVEQSIESWGYDVPDFDIEKVRAQLISAVQQLDSYVLQFFTGAYNLVANIRDMLVSFVTFTSVLYFFLESRSSWYAGMAELSPFSAEDNRKILSSVRDSTQTIFLCSATVGVVHAIVSYVTFVLCGIDLCLILSFVSGFSAMLPVFSSWIVWVPVSLGLYFTGLVVQSIVVAVVHLALLFYVDPLVYSMIPGNTYVTGMSIVMGLYVYGMVGVVAGPLLAGLSLTLVDIYRAYTVVDEAQLDTQFVLRDSESHDWGPGGGSSSSSSLNLHKREKSEDAAAAVSPDSSDSEYEKLRLSLPPESQSRLMMHRRASSVGRFKTRSLSASAVPDRSRSRSRSRGRRRPSPISPMTPLSGVLSGASASDSEAEDAALFFNG